MSHRRNLKVSERIWGSDPGPFEGNDVRLPGGKIGRCIACGSLTQLRLSHVVARWAFKWHKDSWGGKVKTYMLSRGVVTEQQDGNKHYLMCGSCEQRASVSESYCHAIVMQDNSGLRPRLTRHLYRDRYWRLRTDLIAEFIAFTALRAHYAKSIPLVNTNIPAKIRKTLREIIFHGYRSTNVIVAAWRFLPPKGNPNHDPREDLYEMFAEGELGRIYIMQAGGLEWMLAFDPTPQSKVIGFVGFQDRLFQRILTLPYNEHRQFKYPESWALPLREQIASEKRADDPLNGS